MRCAATALAAWCLWPAAALNAESRNLRAGGPGALKAAVTETDMGRFSDCNFEIVMTETKPLGTNFYEKAFWSMNAVLNKAYADRWGHKFTLAQVDVVSKGVQRMPTESWYKVAFLKEHFDDVWREAGSKKCTWLLFMDGTAHISEPDLPLPLFMDKLFKESPINPTTGGIFQKESTNKVSDHIFFLQVNQHGEDLIHAWLNSSQADEGIRFEAAEQGTLTELLFPGKFVTRNSQAVKFFESPHARAHGAEKLESVTVLDADVADEKGDLRWGSFIQDTAALSPGLKRKASIDLLKRSNLRDSAHFDPIISGLAKAEKWTPPAWMPQAEPHKGQKAHKPHQSMAVAQQKAAKQSMGLIESSAPVAAEPLPASAGATEKDSSDSPKADEAEQEVVIGSGFSAAAQSKVASAQEDDLQAEEEEIKQELGESLM